MFDRHRQHIDVDLEEVRGPTARDLAVALGVAVVVGGLYLSQRVIGPLFATAAIILIAGEALVAVAERAPRDRTGLDD